MTTSEHPSEPAPSGNPATNPLVVGGEPSLEDHFFAAGESGTFHEAEHGDPTSVGRLMRGHGSRWWLATGGVAAVVVGGLALVSSLFGHKPAEPPPAPPLSAPPVVAVAPPPPPPVAAPTPAPPAAETPAAATEAPVAAAEAPAVPPPSAESAKPEAPIAAAPAAPPPVQAQRPEAALANPAPAAAPKPEPAAAPPKPAAIGDVDVAVRCRRAGTRSRYREVLDLCPAAFAADPRAADVALLMAQASLERAKPKEAIAWADRAIAIDAKLADAYVVKGGGEQVVGSRAAARDAYKRYLQLAPNGRYATELRTILKSL